MPKDARRLSSSAVFGVMASLSPLNFARAISSEVPAVFAVLMNMKRCLCEIIMDSRLYHGGAFVGTMSVFPARARKY